MSGGKGGGSKTSVQIPQWIQDPMQRGISRAEDMSRMGYQPYYGPEVAAFSPMQVAAMQSSADAASAFGLAPQMDVSAGIPTPTEYVGGVRGYGSGDIFEQSLNEFNKRQPEQAAIYNSLFAGPNVNNVDYGDNGGNNRPVMNGSGGQTNGYTDIGYLTGQGSAPFSGSAQTGYGGGGLGLAEGYGNVDQSGVYGGFGGGYFPAFPISQTAGGTVPVVGAAGGAEPSRTDSMIGGRSAEPIVPETVRFPDPQFPDQTSLMMANYMSPRGNLGFGGFNPYGMGA